MQLMPQSSPLAGLQGVRIAGGLWKRTQKGKLANEEDGKGNEEDGKRNEEEGKRKNSERKPKNAVGNSAVEFYSQNIGKLDKNRADVTGGLSKRTRKKRTKRIGKETKRNEEETERNGKRKRKKEAKKARKGLEKGKRDRKRKVTTETRKHSRAGNAGVKFDAGSKGKLIKNRPDED